MSLDRTADTLLQNKVVQFTLQERLQERVTVLKTEIRSSYLGMMNVASDIRRTEDELGEVRMDIEHHDAELERQATKLAAQCAIVKDASTRIAQLRSSGHDIEASWAGFGMHLNRVLQSCNGHRAFHSAQAHFHQSASEVMTLFIAYCRVTTLSEAAPKAATICQMLSSRNAKRRDARCKQLQDDITAQLNIIEQHRQCKEQHRMALQNGRAQLQEQQAELARKHDCLQQRQQQLAASGDDLRRITNACQITQAEAQRVASLEQQHRCIVGAVDVEALEPRRILTEGLMAQAKEQLGHYSAMECRLADQKSALEQSEKASIESAAIAVGTYHNASALHSRLVELASKVGAAREANVVAKQRLDAQLEAEHQRIQKHLESAKEREARREAHAIGAQLRNTEAMEGRRRGDLVEEMGDSASQLMRRVATLNRLALALPSLQNDFTEEAEALAKDELKGWAKLMAAERKSFEKAAKDSKKRDREQMASKKEGESEKKAKAEATIPTRTPSAPSRMPQSSAKPSMAALPRSNRQPSQESVASSEWSLFGSKTVKQPPAATKMLPPDASRVGRVPSRAAPPGTPRRLPASERDGTSATPRRVHSAHPHQPGATPRRTPSRLDGTAPRAPHMSYFSSQTQRALGSGGRVNVVIEEDDE